MTDSEDSNGDGEWRSVGGPLASMVLTDHQLRIDEAVHELQEVLRSDEELTAEHIDAVRAAQGELQDIIENHLAEVATGTKPWEHGPGLYVPYGVVNEAATVGDSDPDQGQGGRADS